MKYELMSERDGVSKNRSIYVIVCDVRNGRLSNNSLCDVVSVPSHLHTVNGTICTLTYREYLKQEAQCDVIH